MKMRCRQSTGLYIHGMRCRDVLLSVSLLSLVVPLFSGCATVGSSSNTHEIVEFHPVDDVTLTPRESASATQKNDATLAASGYAKIGEMRVQYTAKACSGRAPNLDCTEVSHSDDSTARLLREAAAKGGDVARFNLSGNREITSGSRDGRCLQSETYRTLDLVPVYVKICKEENWSCTQTRVGERRVWVEHRACKEWEKLPYTDTTITSTADVWRHDPAYARYKMLRDVLIHGTRKQVAGLPLERTALNEPLSNGRRPIEMVAQSGNIPALHGLLDLGLDPNESLCSLTSILAPPTITIDDKLKVMNGLTTYGVKLNIRGQGCTVVLARDAETVNRLLRAGVNANASNDYGVNMLSRIAGNPDAEKCAELLLRNGAKINQQHKPSGETALFVAAASENDRLVALLLRKGADPTVRNVNGRTPLDLAQTHLAWMKANSSKVSPEHIPSQEKIVHLLEKGSYR